MTSAASDFIRLPDVREMTGLSKTEIYRRIRDGRFPRSLRLGHRTAVWRKGDVLAWKRGIIVNDLLS